MKDIAYSNCCNKCNIIEMECPHTNCDRDVQIDFHPAPSRPPVVWGTVYDECNCPVAGSLIQLLQCSDVKNGCCIVIGETYSDCSGHYEIPIPPSCRGRYRLEVSGPCEISRQIRGKNNICYY